MKHSYGGFILQAWRHFYMLWEPCVTCMSRSAFHLCNWEKFFSFNCPTCHCKLPLNTDSWVSFGKKIQVHCTESKTQKSACVALILMKMKPSWEYLEEGPPWIATTDLQVKSRDILGKWVWDQIFSLNWLRNSFWIMKKMRKISERKLQAKRHFICWSSQWRCFYFFS